MPATDDQPHTITPSGAFDLCIERLATVPGHPFYPVGTERWPGDAQTWSEWRAFIQSRYAAGLDLSERQNRARVLRALQALPPGKLPYYDFHARTIIER